MSLLKITGFSKSNILRIMYFGGFYYGFAFSIKNNLHSPAFRVIDRYTKFERSVWGMIYITGDCHSDFRRFTKKERLKLPFVFTEEDYVIVCGDFTLLWDKKDREFEYNCEWLSRLPFTLLWVDGNHCGFDLLNSYPVEMWHGGKVHHIVKDKIIHLMRGQIFDIEDKTFFVMGGGKSHDVQGGILDMSDPAFAMLRMQAIRRKLPFRVVGRSYWYEELPSQEELDEGLRSLEKAGNKVDFIISHCTSNRVQEKIARYDEEQGFTGRKYESDILTDYFDMLEDKVQYHHWFCGHYHKNLEIDDKHTILYEKIVPLKEYL